MKKHILLISSLTLFWMTGNTQAPINDECSGAIPITTDGIAITANNANTLVDGPNPTCGGSGIKDVWYSFVYAGGNLTIQTTLGTNTDTRIAVYDACGGNLIACNDDYGGYMSYLALNCTQLVLNSTYYLQAGGYNAIAGTFGLSVTSQAVIGCTSSTALNYNACATIDDGSCENAGPPLNDLCEQAILLEIDSPQVLGNNLFAMPSAFNPTCGNQGTAQMLDMWYKFVASGSEIDLNVFAGSLTDPRVAVYQGSCNGAQIACDDDSGIGNASYLHFYCGDLIQGETYFVRVGGYGALTGNFYVAVSTTNTCVLGENCDVPFNATVGMNEAPAPNSWYVFTPPQNGQYRISTCGLVTCDTKLWIYDYCNMGNFDDSNAATFTYNDDFCGVQAEMTPNLAGGYSYYLRVGDSNSACGSDSIPFLIEYMGPVTGCMDVNACNYSAVAELDAPCFYNDDPECDGIGPDLAIMGDVVFNTLYNTTINSTDACLVNEGCLQGLGSRQILRFSTHIKNIGNQDYFIGVPAANSAQFEWDECHNHYHYEGYAEYLLFDSEGNPMPQIGFKNGFCVLDLECSGGGVAKYGCGNMGITAGCGDIYSSGLACQWIDITDVPDGDYFLVVRTNWDQSPDNAGHYEQRYDNNAAQVCIHFERDSLGNIVNFTKDINNCIPVTDCLDIAFGDNHPDCLGNCPGIAKKGDVVSDNVLTELDVHHYVEATIEQTIPASPCTDLNQDGSITVTDAVMLEACIHGQEEQGLSPEEIGDCPYDLEIINPNHLSTLSISYVDLNEGYADVAVLNPDREIKGMEFMIEGFTIDSVSTLPSIAAWDADLAYEPGGHHITIMGHAPTFMEKFSLTTAVLRVYFESIEGETACVGNIIDIVNLDNHNTLTAIGSCQSLIAPFNASFILSTSTPCIEQPLEITNTSQGSFTTSTWSITGPENFNSSEVHPSFTFTSLGEYDIQLIIQNGTQSDTAFASFTVTGQAFYSDLDGDGFGNSDSAILDCNPPAGYSSLAGDCDDTNANVYPNAPALGNGVDTDCNGTIDSDENYYCLCDVNGDGALGTLDLLALMTDFGCFDCAASDLDQDGLVTTDDVVIFMGCFANGCP
ncbi:MAG: lysyl oxidase family protein [Flavobacteriales bacterium]